MGKFVSFSFTEVPSRELTWITSLNSQNKAMREFYDLPIIQTRKTEFLVVNSFNGFIFHSKLSLSGAFLVAQTVKNTLAMGETQVRSQG